jgi:hypothetical protein
MGRKGKGSVKNGRGEEGRGGERKGDGKRKGREEGKDCPPSLYLLKVALFL